MQLSVLCIMCHCSDHKGLFPLWLDTLIFLNSISTFFSEKRQSVQGLQTNDQWRNHQGILAIRELVAYRWMDTGILYKGTSHNQKGFPSAVYIVTL